VHGVEAEAQPGQGERRLSASPASHPSIMTRPGTQSKIVLLWLRSTNA
jgi:hypothetical protein